LYRWIESDRQEHGERDQRQHRTGGQDHLRQSVRGERTGGRE
jgi:hypothetical protein